MKNYLALLKKIARFVEAIRAQHPESFSCGPGCADCCVAGIRVSRVEFDRIRKHLSPPVRPESVEGRTDRCRFLDADMKCSIYDARPVVCRLWGAPLLFPSDPLEPMPDILSRKAAVREGTLTCCEKNFRKGQHLNELGAGDMIAMETVLTTLAAINHVYCKTRGLDPKERLQIS